MPQVDHGHQQRSDAGTSRQAALVVQGGPQDGTILPLSPETTTLGRESDNHVVLDEAAVSRRHALIVKTNTDHYLSDLGSTNGTYINRQKIEEGERLLRHGDVIHLGTGSVSYKFQHTGAATMVLSSTELPSDEVVVDAKGRNVYLSGERLEPPLSKREFDMLAILDARRGEAVSRDDIAMSVWSERPEGDVGNHEDRAVRPPRACPDRGGTLQAQAACHHTGLRVQAELTTQ